MTPLSESRSSADTVSKKERERVRGGTSERAIGMNCYAKAQPSKLLSNMAGTLNSNLFPLPSFVSASGVLFSDGEMDCLSQAV